MGMEGTGANSPQWISMFQVLPQICIFLLFLLLSVLEGVFLFSEALLSIPLESTSFNHIPLFILFLSQATFLPSLSLPAPLLWPIIALNSLLKNNLSLTLFSPQTITSLSLLIYYQISQEWSIPVYILVYIPSTNWSQFIASRHLSQEIHQKHSLQVQQWLWHLQSNGFFASNHLIWSLCDMWLVGLLSILKPVPLLQRNIQKTCG